ncbi:MAG TPA: DUF4331 family protein [Nannocystaceae bacterium]|nr:DUF4331 family protein [Nannocystaceae bacterium]
MQRLKSNRRLAVIALAATCGVGWWATTVLASDHDESPLVKEDAAQDITDLYVFDSGGGTTTIIVCWAGFNDSRPQPDAEGVYDENALYTIWVDNDGDNEGDISIRWRYGRNANGDVGVRWEDVPGAIDDVSGPTEVVFEVGEGARTWSGHADDPFFFDAQGYLETLDTGTVMLMNNRDFLAGLNVTAAAIEIDTALLQEGDSPMQFWATAARK